MLAHSRQLADQLKSALLFPTLLPLPLFAQFPSLPSSSLPDLPPFHLLFHPPFRISLHFPIHAPASLPTSPARSPSILHHSSSSPLPFPFLSITASCALLFFFPILCHFPSTSSIFSPPATLPPPLSPPPSPPSLPPPAYSPSFTLCLSTVADLIACRH